MIAGEPVLADDAARSLATGERQPPLPPATMADGLLTGLSDRTFAIIREHVAEIITVTEAEILEAMQTVWLYTKQLIEPSAAVAVAADAQAPARRPKSRSHPVGWQRRLDRFRGLR